MLKKAEVESLRELIETLKKRIDGHGSRLAESEALTRYALVDPLLRELGWDTEDPAQVRPEYPLKSKDSRADYVLLGDDIDESGCFLGTKPVLLIEAKKLSRECDESQHDSSQGRLIEGNEPPSEGNAEKELWNAALQALPYAASAKVRYFAVTDGQRWHVYDGEKEGGLEKGRISCFDLKEEFAINGCRLAEELWRDNPNPKGTKRIVEAGEVCLDAEGYVLGRWSKKGRKPKESYPPNAQYWVEGRFLDVNGYRLKKNGDRYSGAKPYKPRKGYEGPYQYQPPTPNQTSQPHPGPKPSIKPSQASQEPEPTRDRKEWGLGYELPSQTSQARR